MCRHPVTNYWTIHPTGYCSHESVGAAAHPTYQWCDSHTKQRTERVRPQTSSMRYRSAAAPSLSGTHYYIGLVERCTSPVNSWPTGRTCTVTVIRTWTVILSPLTCTVRTFEPSFNTWQPTLYVPSLNRRDPIVYLWPSAHELKKKRASLFSGTPPKVSQIHNFCFSLWTPRPGF